MTSSRSQHSRRRQTEITIKQRYADAYRKYVSSEFTYNSHCLLRKLCQNGEKQPGLYNIPLYNIMIEIAKIMMMNELQLLFFGATVEQMGWKKVNEPCLNDYINDVTDITPKIQAKGELIKKLQLSLLLIAYIVKIYLNEESSIYDFKIRDLVKSNFQKMYQDWVAKVQNHFKFSPKHMNKLFKDFDKGSSPIKEQIVDYNQLVAKLFDNNKDDDHYEREKPEKTSVRLYDRQKDEQNYLNANYNKKMGGLSVYEQEDLALPQMNNKAFSSRSIVSGIDDKRQSIHELFNQGELKPSRQISHYDQDFMGNDHLI